MELRPHQVCRSTEGWQVVRIQSSTDPNTTYTVHVSPWRADESICECPGFIFHAGRCKHQQPAYDKVCRWTANEDAPTQMPDERDDKICPRCGGPTKWEVEVVE